MQAHIRFSFNISSAYGDSIFIPIFSSNKSNPYCMKVNVMLFACLVAISIFLACKKDSATTSLSIKLTDAPASYEEVNVDLQQVRIKFDSDTTSWIDLQTNAGIYNLLELQDGIDTLISEAIVPQGKVKEVRLVLGQNNSIKTGGEVLPLTIPSGSESGLKIKVSKELRTAVDSLTIDFDAALSIFNESGEYKLKPVLRVIE